MTTPWTQDQVRSFALSLPEAHEHSHFGRPDLRVRKKIFATLPENGRTVNLKITPLDLDTWLRTDAETYSNVWGGRWMGVVLARIDPDELRALLVDAYCLAAPKPLASALRAMVR